MDCFTCSESPATCWLYYSTVPIQSTTNISPRLSEFTIGSVDHCHCSIRAKKNKSDTIRKLQTMQRVCRYYLWAVPNVTSLGGCWTMTAIIADRIFIDPVWQIIAPSDELIEFLVLENSPHIIRPCGVSWSRSDATTTIRTKLFFGGNRKHGE